MKNYKQLTEAIRYQISSHFKAGFSQTEISLLADVYKSTISPEIKRKEWAQVFVCKFQGGMM